MSRKIITLPVGLMRLAIFLIVLLFCQAQMRGQFLMRNGSYNKAKQALLKEINDLDFTKSSQVGMSTERTIRDNSAQTNGPYNYNPRLSKLNEYKIPTRTQDEMAKEFIQILNKHCKMPDNLCLEKIRRNRSQTINPMKVPSTITSRSSISIEQPATNIINYTNRDEVINNNSLPGYNQKLADMLFNLELYFKNLDLIARGKSIPSK